MELTKAEIERNKKEYADIQDFVNKTYDGCLKRNISISLNTKTGRIEWHKAQRK